MHEQCAEGLHFSAFHCLLLWPDRTPLECFVKICFREVSSFQVLLLYHCRVNSMISACPFDIKGEGYSVLKDVTYCVSIQYICTGRVVRPPALARLYMVCICTGYNNYTERTTNLVQMSAFLTITKGWRTIKDTDAIYGSIEQTS